MSGEANLSDKRAAFGALNRLVGVWVAPANPPAATTDPPAAYFPGFERFVYENVLPVCLEFPITKAFDYTDGQSFLVRPSSRLRTERVGSDIGAQLLGEMTTLLKTLYVRRGQEVITYLDGLLKAMSYPPDRAQALLTAIATTNECVEPCGHVDRQVVSDTTHSWHDLKKFYAVRSISVGIWRARPMDVQPFCQEMRKVRLDFIEAASKAGGSA
jgi:hypothetical protein